MNCLIDPMCFDGALLECLGVALRAVEDFAYSLLGTEWGHVADALAGVVERIRESMEFHACASADSAERAHV